MSEEVAPMPNRKGPKGLVKSRHQITYLAHQVTVPVPYDRVSFGPIEPFFAGLSLVLGLKKHITGTLYLYRTVDYPQRTSRPIVRISAVGHDFVSFHHLVTFVHFGSPSVAIASPPPPNLFFDILGLLYS